jgi:ketosteroid isomerase-like protein
MKIHGSRQQRFKPDKQLNVKTKISAPLLFWMFLAGNVLAQSGETASQNGNDPTSQIRQLLTAQEKAWNAGDIDGFMDGYARVDSITFVSGDDVSRGWQTVYDRYKKKYGDHEKMGKLTFSDLEISLLGRNAALASGRWKLDRHTDQPHGRFTLILRLRSDGWRIVYDHTSTAGQ